MNKSVLSIIVALAVIGVLAYFLTQQKAQPTETINNLAPDEALNQEIQAIETIDLDNEFKEIDAALNQL